jgi:hypothetical protein
LPTLVDPIDDEVLKTVVPPPITGFALLRDFVCCY